MRINRAWAICGGAVLVLFLLGMTVLANSAQDRIQAKPVNKNASDGAQKLLRLLYEINGQYTLSGQHDYLEAPDHYYKWLKQLTGDYPAVKGYEFGGITNQTEKELAGFRDKVVKNAIEWNKSGSIVTISYHMNQPGACYCWNMINNGGISGETFQEIITPGTDLYKKHIADLDRTAVYLKKLRDAGVPVLWRPYHEMNGKWFWWGGQPDFAKLWEIMYERYTKVHKLNNLLWVWSAATLEWADDFEKYYVGPERADVIAIDIYDNKYEQEYYDRLVRLAEGKPVALGENGELPADEVLSEAQNHYVWFMTWSEMIEEKNAPDQVQALYANDRVLTRDELSKMRQSSR
ncbi:glycosyl hydrolase [Cohnella thailandensis]|uniref:Glycosyl hydrolase n=1 Tax=Cohnella thailandensis TaxID=557557 RepID=A0A841SRX4_9BACL|nr:glycosyl hydrolase [Cohnella thailandensis]MBB6635123.1 glycosyl hydrolase [Cohnella thailandensis]MBP1974411.1 mannan endo-1,4-beta-mannosidase [Cohnella thailandensis]